MARDKTDSGLILTNTIMRDKCDIKFDSESAAWPRYKH